MEILDILNNLGNHKEEIAFAGFCLTSGIAATFASIVPSSFIFSELAKKNSKRLGFSLGDLLFRIQNKKDKSIVYPEMRAFDGYEVDSIFEGTSYFLTDEDMYKVADDKYNVIRE